MVTGSSTAAALIDAAEQHFALDGFDGASLRAVMRAAGADPGSIHYHFGDRRALAGAVLDRILAPLNTRRLDLLASAEDRHGGAGSVPPAELVEALIRPDLEVARDLSQRGRGRARLIGAIYLDPAAFVTERVEAHFGPVAERFLPHLTAALPALPPDLLAWRVRWFVFGPLGALLSDPDEPLALGPAALTNRLVTAATAALAAPNSDSDTDIDSNTDPDPDSDPKTKDKP